MKPEWDEESVDGAEDESSARVGAVFHEEAAHALVDESVEDRVDEAHDHSDEHRGDRGDDRNEAATAEETEVGRKFDPVVALIEKRGDDTDDDAAEHSVVDDVLTLTIVRAEDRSQRGEDAVEDHIADDGSQCRGTVGLLGEADGDTDGEDQRQIVKQSGAGGGEDRRYRQQPIRELAETIGTEHVRLSEPHQQGRGRQHRDREHERTADALKLRESRHRPLAFLR